MIAKKYRLREYEVSRVFRKGKPFFGRFWTLNALVDRRLTHHRMAVSISKKADKRAVMRNKYRRTVYDALLSSLQFTVSSLENENKKSGTENPSVGGLRIEDGKLKTANYLCIFTLKKGLKLEDQVPSVWIDDASALLQKAVRSAGGGTSPATYRGGRPSHPRSPIPHQSV